MSCQPLGARAGKPVPRGSASEPLHRARPEEFPVRAVHYLGAISGSASFLDIGAGLPTANNAHEVAAHAAEDRRTHPRQPTTRTRS
ncbi:MAG: SAM-dependent methyltransferase [Pseudonocardiaceae bacterium]